VTASTCGAGTCSASSSSTETQACTRTAPGPQTCAAPSYGAWSACSFSDVCAQTGTQTRTVTSSTYSCAAGQCVASTSTETQACTRTTNGNSCGTPSYGNWSSCGSYSNTCDETGTQSRSVTASTCSNGTCGAPTTSTQTQACSRSTQGNVCSSSESCGGCSFSDYCTTVGSMTCTEYYTTCSSQSCSAGGGSSSYSTTCYRPAPPQSCSTRAPSYGPWTSCPATCGSATRSRQVTTYKSSFNCSTGGCTDSPNPPYTETEPCPVMPCPASSYGSWGACTGYSDTCDETGTQERSVTSYSCNGSSCVGSSSTQTQSCSRSTGGTVCQITPGTWSACGGFSDYCDATGTQTTKTLVKSCGSGSCSNSTYLDDSRECTRVPPGPQACATTYGPWSACNGSNACGVGGTQSRTVTTNAYNCGTGQCAAVSTTTETQSCSGTQYPEYAVCGGTCTNLDHDPKNCGSCGRVCPYKYSACDYGQCCDPYWGCI
jgi:hypothetical protein